MEDVVIISACRTPVGKVPGQLSSISDIDLVTLCLSEAINRAGIDKDYVQEVIVGCSFPKENYNLGRRAVTTAGLLPETIGSTINKTCSSSIEAMEVAKNKIAVGEAEVILVGGVESMSNSSYALRFFKKNVRALMKNEIPEYKDIVKNIEENEMPFICEILAKKHNITREEQDIYAIRSHLKAESARNRQLFKDEIIPVKVEKNGVVTYFCKDEIIDPHLTLEVLARESPFFIRDGQITKYNSAAIGDAGAAVLLASESFVSKMRIKPMVRIKSFASVGLDTESFGMGVLKAVKKNLCKLGLTERDLDLFECNESFAVQSIINQRELGVDDDRYNVKGGGIALGYPVGCTGLRICVSLIYSLIQARKHLGIASICAGGGMGQSVIFENMENSI